MGGSSVLSTAPLSNLTLALFEDSGWYLPNYAAADVLPWGRGAGCPFASAECVSNGVIVAGGEGFFCDATNSATQCVYDFSAAGTCAASALADGCPVVQQFANRVWVVGNRTS
jgi:leishmanolysin